jgi:acyl-CoA synthetase (AMP-forming)/AMP-acid ligase II
VVVIPVTDGPLPLLPDPVPDGTIGEIVVRGPVVTGGYLARPDAVTLAKTDWDGRLAHRMGDLGWFDADGRLWFCGRVAHRVVTAEGTLFPLPCEEVFAVHPRVARAALVGIGPPGRQQPVLCVEVEPGTPPDDRLTEELLALGARNHDTRGIRTIRYHPGFPVDARHNAKVGYEELARWVEEHP